MKIVIPDIVKTVEIWEFTFVSGLRQSFSIDTAAGDSVLFDEAGTISVHIESKPSPIDDKGKIATQDFVILPDHLAFYSNQQLEVKQLTQEEKKQHMDALRQLSAGTPRKALN